MGWFNTIIRFLISVKWLNPDMLSLARLREVYSIHSTVSNLITSDGKERNLLRTKLLDEYWNGYKDAIGDVKQTKMCGRCKTLLARNFRASNEERFPETAQKIFDDVWRLK